MKSNISRNISYNITTYVHIIMSWYKLYITIILAILVVLLQSQNIYLLPTMGFTKGCCANNSYKA